MLSFLKDRGKKGEREMIDGVYLTSSRFSLFSSLSSSLSLSLIYLNTILSYPPLHTDQPSLYNSNIISFSRILLLSIILPAQSLTYERSQKVPSWILHEFLKLALPLQRLFFLHNSLIHTINS